MKKVIFAAGLTAVLLITSACGDKAASDDGPETVPVEWVNAHIQKDQGTMVELLDKEQSALDPEDEADNDLKVKNYQLTEWKADNDRYFYEIKYEHPEENRMKTDRMEVVKTNDGWKRAKYGDISDFDELVSSLEPKVLEELHNR